eukprot:TRINITY_DN70_c0_g1_i3.p1 TRINITY_DN70_c0_g1~~TRINITY_DN70_c0_g1_i3.p1  ORF type:complete len:633 (+),score=160.04 TRINITY_DN70_c0_g1_i3:1243-3141(+)
MAEDDTERVLLECVAALSQQKESLAQALVNAARVADEARRHSAQLQKEAEIRQREEGASSMALREQLEKEIADQLQIQLQQESYELAGILHSLDDTSALQQPNPSCASIGVSLLDKPDESCVAVSESAVHTVCEREAALEALEADLLRQRGELQKRMLQQRNAMTVLKKKEEEVLQERAEQERLMLEREERCELALKQILSGTFVGQQGFLKKKGAQVKRMKRRWCILKIDGLYYYKQQTDPKPQGIIPLTNIKDITTLSELSFGLRTTTRTFFLEGSTADETREWLEAIMRTALLARNLINKPELLRLLKHYIAPSDSDSDSDVTDADSLLADVATDPFFPPPFNDAVPDLMPTPAQQSAPSTPPTALSSDGRLYARPAVQPPEPPKAKAVKPTLEHKPPAAPLPAPPPNPKPKAKPALPSRPPPSLPRSGGKDKPKASDEEADSEEDGMPALRPLAPDEVVRIKSPRKPQQDQASTKPKPACAAPKPVFYKGSLVQSQWKKPEGTRRDKPDRQLLCAGAVNDEEAPSASDATAAPVPEVVAGQVNHDALEQEEHPMEESPAPGEAADKEQAQAHTSVVPAALEEVANTEPPQVASTMQQRAALALAFAFTYAFGAAFTYAYECTNPQPPH